MSGVWLWLGAVVGVAVGVVVWQVRAAAARRAQAAAPGGNVWLEKLYAAPCYVREEADRE